MFVSVGVDTAGEEGTIVVDPDALSAVDSSVPGNEDAVVTLVAVVADSSAANTASASCSASGSSRGMPGKKYSNKAAYTPGRVSRKRKRKGEKPKKKQKKNRKNQKKPKTKEKHDEQASEFDNCVGQRTFA